MKDIEWPSGFSLERLRKSHPRKKFSSGQPLVDDWLKTKAFQHQEKHLSSTKVLLDDVGEIVGYFTLATGQVDFQDLPADISKTLPRRPLPVAVLAWLGVSIRKQGQSLGSRLLAQALRDCYEAGKSFAFIAVILDCVNDSAKAFYQRYEFQELPGHPYRLFFSTARLNELMGKS